ncbi:MAG: hypothetical protein JRN62_03345 [Nitrososphaerota archaeon]|jgi:hypothetical protein|nr:hypothetical protein [Nitrososphaerota archaeon]MDG6948633.1 hypothetical protein [Nitrososphaerota archaeon]
MNETSLDAIKNLKDVQLDYDYFRRSFKSKRLKATGAKAEDKSMPEQGSQVIEQTVVHDPAAFLELIGGEAK